MDETDSPQTPAELLVILAAMADERMPIQTIAPKFTGRFNKGVDYVGDVEQFEKEFEEDLAVIAFAVKRYGLPANLKLSVHSGSGQVFDLYGDSDGAGEVRRGRSFEDGGDDMAGGADRAGGSGRRRAGAGQGDLRRGTGAHGRVVRAVCGGDRH